MASLPASDSQTQSCWLIEQGASVSAGAAAYPPLQSSLRDVDVCVIGAGLAGLSVAYECATSGLSVVVLEDSTRVGSGDSLRTSSFLSSSLIDCAVIARIHGDAHAHLAVQSHAAAIERVESIARAEGIQCHLERVPGYLMPNCTDEEAAKKAAKEDRRAPQSMMDEMAAARLCGLDVRLEESGPPLNQRGAVAEGSGPGLAFAAQAVFQPHLYLLGLAAAVTRHGGRIYCGTRAKEWQGGSAESTRVITSEGHIVHCKSIMLATNSGEGNALALNDRVISNRSYAIGARVPKGSLQHCCVWSMDRDDKSYAPYTVTITSHPHSKRTENAPPQTADESAAAVGAGATSLPSDADLSTLSEEEVDYIVISGQDHPVGELSSTSAAEERWKKLEAWARERWQFGPVEQRWSGQVLMPIDHLAYTGLNPAAGSGVENVFIHTGGGSHALTSAVIAGQLVRDLILKKENQLKEVYNPARLPPRAWLDYAKHVTQSTLHYFRWLKLAAVGHDTLSEDRVSAVRGLEDLAPGTGAVLFTGGQFVAGYRDTEGKLHRHSAVCPHMRGIVCWNPAEKSFDCALHGSRFDALGRRINGPATEDLQPLDEQAKAEQQHMCDKVEKARMEDDVAIKERQQANAE